MFQRYIILLISAAVFPALVFGVAVIPCENGRPPLAIHVENCPTAPCHVSNGSFFNYQVDWISSAASTDLHLEMYGRAFGLTFEFPTDELVLCDILIVGSCPVSAGQALVVYSSIEVVTPILGGLPAQLEFIVKYDNGDISACTLVDVIMH